MAGDDRELVRRFQRGEVAAFEALCARYGSRLYCFCYRLCGHAADAEDLTQEVLVAAYQGLDRFAGRSSVITWLYRIALYRWRRLRDAAPPETLPLDALPEGAATAPDLASMRIERLDLDKAIGRLPGNLREALLLVKVEGLKYREAARVLGVPQGTVKSRVHDAVERLRRMLTDDEEAAAVCGGSGRRLRGGTADDEL